MPQLEIVITAIPNIFAVWNVSIEDYEFSGTLEECRRYINDHNR